jgi:exopolysaccharide biosynthesis protein
MIRRAGIRRHAILASALLCVVALAREPQLDLKSPRQLAPGVTLYYLDTPTLVDPAGPLSIWLVRLDPGRADLRVVLANDEIMGTETVAGIAERHRAVAAINAGFFAANGDPSGVLTLAGRLVSDTRRPRGAVGISRETDGVKLLFGWLRATATLTLQNGRTRTSIDVDGVDTTRLLGKLMLFTPSYHADTDTAPGGLEWVVDGAPQRVVSGPHKTGKTAIPREGFVLSFGGTRAAGALAGVKRGSRVTVNVTYDPVEGEPERWASAHDVVGGAGLLVRNGRDVADWAIEAFAQGFAENRHPRTMIGNTADGTIWLITVDGRQPHLSVGMTLVELRALARRLELVNALNLDGGGSTTMWAQGQVMNSPSDAAGPRKVSDALLVYGVGARVP